MASEFVPSDEFVAQIRRGANRLARRMRLERPADSPGSTKVAVLAHLYRWGPATPGELAVAERLQPQSLTRVIADLARDGMLTRRRDERDRRQSVLEITDEGTAALIADMRARDRWLAQAIEELTETEQQVLHLAGVLMDRLSGLGRPAHSAHSADSAHEVLRVADERGPEGEDAGLGEQQHDQAE